MLAGRRGDRPRATTRCCSGATRAPDAAIRAARRGRVEATKRRIDRHLSPVNVRKVPAAVRQPGNIPPRTSGAKDLRETKDYAVAFADIAASTRIYRELGDLAARDLTQSYCGRVVALLPRFDGHLVKTL